MQGLLAGTFNGKPATNNAGDRTDCTNRRAGPLYQTADYAPLYTGG